MKVEQYQVKNNMSMDPMHDSYADEIRIENNYLIIVYDKWWFFIHKDFK